MEFYKRIFYKKCKSRSNNDHVTMCYVEKKKDIPSGDNSQYSHIWSEKRQHEKSRRGLLSKIYYRVLISPLVAKASHKVFLKDMSQVPLMVSDGNSQIAHQQDIVMIEAGIPYDTWTYRVEREKLAAKSEWFRAMLIGPLAPPVTDPPPLLQLHHIDKRAFDHFLSYLHDEPVNFTSVSTARATLDAAHQYLCPELARFAAAFLEKNLRESTVLEIYQGLRLYANCPIADYNSPNSLTSSENVADEIAAVCTNLLLKCLSVIDSNPATVLCQERFEELSAQEVAEIARRDTLNLNSECILFSALDRWAAAECRRQGVEPLSFNKRAVLSDDICFSVRYLLMNDREFVNGPMASGILTNEECVYIVSRILRHPESLEDDNIRGTSAVPSSMLSGTPRIGTYNCESQNCNCILKPGKKERQDNRKNMRKECINQGQRTCARIGNCLVQVLSCIFD